MDVATRRELLARFSGGGALMTQRVFQPLALRLCLSAPYWMTPNLLTLASLAIGLVAALILGCFPGFLAASVAAYGLLLLGYLLDCADGLLARMRDLASPPGAVLDAMSDCVVHAAVALAVAYSADLDALWSGALLAGFCAPTLVTFMDRVIPSSSRREGTAGSGSRRASHVLLWAVMDYPVMSALLLAAGVVDGSALRWVVAIMFAVSCALVCRLLWRCAVTGPAARVGAA